MKIDNREPRFVSAVVYIHNDGDLVESFLQGLYDIFISTFKKFEIICVNDASTDLSVEKIKRTARNFENNVLSIINMGYYQGMELSMNAGEDLAIGDFVYEFDSVHMDYETSLIKDVYFRALDGYDLVSASPIKKTKKTSSIFYKLFNSYSKSIYDLQTEKFRIVSRRGINRISSINHTVLYRKAVNANSGLKMDVLEYEPTNKGIKEKEFTSERRNLAVDALILFTNIGYKFSLIMSLFMIFAVVAIAIYTTVIYISGNPVEGWTPIMIFISIGFFGIFVVFTVCLKYLSLILNLIFKKQRYIIEGVEKIKV